MTSGNTQLVRNEQIPDNSTMQRGMESTSDLTERLYSRKEDKLPKYRPTAEHAVKTVKHARFHQTSTD